ncbi:hypothetical protein D3C86_1772460 [compost metagenome]
MASRNPRNHLSLLAYHTTRTTSHRYLAPTNQPIQEPFSNLACSFQHPQTPLNRHRLQPLQLMRLNQRGVLEDLLR